MNLRLTYVYEDTTGKRGEQISVTLEHDADYPITKTWFDHCESGEFFAPDDLGLPTAYFDSVGENQDTYFHLHKLIDAEMTEEDATINITVAELAERWSQHYNVGFVGRGE